MSDSIEIARSSYLQTLKEAQQVRVLRNKVRQFMTRNQEFITPEMQAEWFKNYRKDVESGHLKLYFDKYDCFLGYGYVKLDMYKFWVATLAVDPEFQGKSIGTQIYRDLIRNYGRVKIEIFTDNKESLGAAHKSGFRITSIGDKTVAMEAISEHIGLIDDVQGVTF